MVNDSVRTDDEYGSIWQTIDHANLQVFHRTDGPAIMDHGEPYQWWVNGVLCDDADEYRVVAGITKEEMFALILKYGDIK